MTDFGLVCLTSDITGIAVGVSSKNSPELKALKTFLLSYQHYLLTKSDHFHLFYMREIY